MNRTDIQQDWPADPANDDLLRLAEQLQAAAPPLPPEAMARVQQQMEAELDAAQRRIRYRRVAFGWSIAAAILLALGGYVYFRDGADHGPPVIVRDDGPLAPPMIEDRITIALGESSVAPSEKALVRLEENRSLFTD
jgi:hypothetical protein